MMAMLIPGTDAISQGIEVTAGGSELERIFYLKQI
jgi:hypothetical protein